MHGQQQNDRSTYRGSRVCTSYCSSSTSSPQHSCHLICRGEWLRDVMHVLSEVESYNQIEPTPSYVDQWFKPKAKYDLMSN